MYYSIKTIEIEIARIEQALRVIRSTPFRAVDCDTGYLPSTKELEECLEDLYLAKKVLRDTDIQEAMEKYRNRD